jgi:hypothetical protein
VNTYRTRTWRPPARFCAEREPRPDYRIDLTVVHGRSCLRFVGDFTSPSATVLVRGVLARVSKLRERVEIDAGGIVAAGADVATMIDVYTAAAPPERLAPAGLLSGAAG